MPGGTALSITHLAAGAAALANHVASRKLPNLTNGSSAPPNRVTPEAESSSVSAEEGEGHSCLLTPDPCPAFMTFSTRSNAFCSLLASLALECPGLESLEDPCVRKVLSTSAPGAALGVTDPACEPDSPTCRNLHVSPRSHTPRCQSRHTPRPSLPEVPLFAPPLKGRALL